MWRHFSESTQVGLSAITRPQLGALWDKYDADDDGLEADEIKLMVREFTQAQQQLIKQAMSNSNKKGGHKAQLMGHPMATLLEQIVDAELSHKLALLEIKRKYVESTDPDTLLAAMALDDNGSMLMDRAQFLEHGSDVLFAERKALARLSAASVGSGGGATKRI